MHPNNIRFGRYIMNFLEELDAATEYYYDRATKE